MAFVDITQQNIQERDKELARRKALRDQIGRGLDMYAQSDRQRKLEERQSLRDQMAMENRDLMLAEKYGYNPRREEFLGSQGLIDEQGQEMACEASASLSADWMKGSLWSHGRIKS